jgi:uroporphyrinogen III methyltransferase/synthase
VSDRTSVYLIGAGPGDPGLFTVRGRECLQLAGVVVHDDDVPAAILKWARPDAEIIGVGVGGGQQVAQAAIGYLLAEKVREGHVVARLKWGDPFVFERGGEEALYLHEQGVRFEVVPGVVPALATPAYAGIPITYPGGGDTLTIVRPFDEEQRALPHAQWAHLSGLEGTLVFQVGAHQLGRLLNELETRGWSPRAAAALVMAGTLPTQAAIDGTLEEIADHARTHPRLGPAILVIGRVVGFREHLRWFDNRPLFGARVLITRPQGQAAELSERLSALGAETVEAPMIQVAAPADLGPLQEAARRVATFDWIVFTSVNAVDAFMSAALDVHRDVRSLAGPRVAVIGTSTAERVARYGIRADLVPEEFDGEGLVAALRRQATLTGVRILLPHSDIARELIASELQTSGAEVTEVVAYRTIINEAIRDAGDVDVYRQLLDHRIGVVTFTSPSAVNAFATIFGEDQAADLLAHTIVASIGPVTSRAVRQLGVNVAVEPHTHTVDGLVRALAAYVSQAHRAIAGS